jgi:hypothetical protein
MASRRCRKTAYPTDRGHAEEPGRLLDLGAARSSIVGSGSEPAPLRDA